MKKLIGTFIVAVSLSGLNAQNTTKSVKVVGSFDYGQKEITSFVEEPTGCIRKSSPHQKGIFVSNEIVQIEIDENKQMAEVIKLNLNEKVFVNKTCEGNGFDYSQLTPDQKINEFEKIGQIHNNGLRYTYDYILSKKTTNTTVQQVKIFAEQGVNQYILQLGDSYKFGDNKKFVNEVFQSNNLQTLLDQKINQMSLSTAQINFLANVEVEFSNLYKHQNSRLFDQILIQLEYSAINQLSDEEELPILGYMAVARASVNYWVNCGDNWINNVPHAKKPSYWGNVGKADGKGAAAGAGAWGAGALFGGPVTWSAFGVSVGGWAVGCSIYEMF